MRNSARSSRPPGELVAKTNPACLAVNYLGEVNCSSSEVRMIQSQRSL